MTGTITKWQDHEEWQEYEEWQEHEEWQDHEESDKINIQ